ncbi:MAG: M48 family metallopeptidase [Krumholzibacteria bacterium]|nr:M48 family metallopeptidase [Candidatus Krumholzibacteria bacterium]
MPPLLVAAAVATAPARAAERPTGEFAWLNTYQNRSYTLRPSVNANPFVYVPIERDLATLELRSGLFPLLGPETITIGKVELDTRRGVAEMAFTGERGEKGQLRFIAPRNSDETMGQQHIDSLLALVTSDAGVLPHVLNAATGVVHFKGSNHGRGFPAGAEYATPQEALADGHTLCPSCFAPIHLLPDYEKEMALGRQVAVQVRGSFPAVTDDAVQRRLREAGARVLDRWPLPLRGYPYRFTAVEAPTPNAVACPGGWIFVHDGMLEMCETDLELEAVLAHEISHVEMRHGLRQLRSAEKAARIGALTGILMAGAVASQDNDAGVAVAAGVAMIVTATASELALAGYSRDMELEADAAAVHYLVRAEGEQAREHQARILEKLEYYGECARGQRRDRDGFSSHPASNVRSGLARDAETAFFAEPRTFDFTTADGAHYRLSINAICHHAYFETWEEDVYDDQQSYEFGLGGAGSELWGHNRTDTRIFATVEAGAGVERGTEFKDMDLLMDGQWVKFDNKEDTALYPNASTSMVLVNRRNGLLQYTSLLPAQVRHSGRAAEAKQEKKDQGGALR